MKLNYGKTFLLGFGFFGVSVIWMVYNTFVPLFLANRFGLNAGWIGFFMTLDNIAALFIQPAVGSWSDRLRTPIGRRMPFILIGAPVGALAFGLIPLAAVLPLFVACTSTLLLSMAFWRTPVVALMPDITPSKYRSQANGIINFMGGVGAIIATLGGSKLYAINQAYPFWLASALVLLSALLVFLFIKEPKEYETTSSERPNLWKAFLEVLRSPDRSALRILLAIFFWFVAYNAIEAFFTLYAQNHLGLPGEDGARLLGQLSLIFVLFALPAGYIGARFGRRKTILTGIVLMSACMLAMFLLPAATLLIPLTALPVLGEVPVIGLILMLAGGSWSLINVNSLPMVVDMTDDLRIGTYTGLYYLFSTLAAITGPNINGQIIRLTGNNYSLVMLVGPVFMLLALVMMLGVRRGEAKKRAANHAAMIEAAPAWKDAYPGAHCGFLAMRGVRNPPVHEELDARKRALEAALRQQFAGFDRPALDAYGMLPAYAAYYKAFGKTYHVRAQLESVVFKGKDLPGVVALVEAMFMAEIKNLLLTAGHDLDALALPVTVDVVTGNEKYTLLRGQEQTLKAGDMYMNDRVGVISSILYGPDARTQITSQTRNVLFAVYAPAGVGADAVHAHLADIRDYVNLIAPAATVVLLEILAA